MHGIPANASYLCKAQRNSILVFLRNDYFIDTQNIILKTPEHLCQISKCNNSNQQQWLTKISSCIRFLMHVVALYKSQCSMCYGWACLSVLQTYCTRTKKWALRYNLYRTWSPNIFRASLSSEVLNIRRVEKKQLYKIVTWLYCINQS